MHSEFSANNERPFRECFRCKRRKERNAERFHVCKVRRKHNQCRRTVFALIMLKGDMLTGFFSTETAVIQNGYDYLKGFALETLVTAVLFSMIGYFNGNNKTVWVMTQGLIQTLLVRLPLAYFMSIQPNASLTKIGLAAPVSTTVGILLNVGFYLYLNKKEKRA